MWLPKTTAPKIEEQIKEEIKEEIKIYKKPTVPTPAFEEPRAYIKKVPIAPESPVEETIKETIKEKVVDEKIKEEIKEEIKIYEKPTVPTPAFEEPRAYLKKVPIVPETTVKETIKKEVERAPEAIAPPPVITAPPVEDDIKTFKKPAPGSRQNGGIDMAY